MSILCARPQKRKRLMSVSTEHSVYEKILPPPTPEDCKACPVLSDETPPTWESTTPSKKHRSTPGTWSTTAADSNVLALKRLHTAGAAVTNTTQLSADHAVMRTLPEGTEVFHPRGRLDGKPPCRNLTPFRDTTSATSVHSSNSKPNIKVRGQLHLAIEAHGDIINVHVMEGKHLRSKSRSSSDAFIKLSLQPETSATNATLETTAAPQEQPLFNQHFSFKILDDDKKKRLYLSVWNKELNGCEFIGSMSFGIKHLLLSRKATVGWYYLLSQELGLKKHLQARSADADGLKLKAQNIDFVMENKENHDVGSEMCSSGMSKLTLLLKKSCNGFGFTVKGQCPVQVGLVESKTAADVSGLKKGDIIQRINGQRVLNATAATVAQIVRNAQSHVVLDVYRKNDNQSREMNSSTVEFPQESHKKRLDMSAFSSPSPIGKSCQASHLAKEDSNAYMKHRNNSGVEINYKDNLRPLAVRKLIECTQRFVLEMHSGVQRYSRPLRHRLLSQNEHALLFQNAEKLVVISEYLLRQLGKNEDQVGAIFRTKLALICEAYNAYTSGLCSAIALLVELKSFTEFNDFLVECDSQNIYQNETRLELDIDEFIYRPAQHFKELLIHLQAVLAVTGINHTDNINLHITVNRLSDCYSLIRSNFERQELLGDVAESAMTEKNEDSFNQSTNSSKSSSSTSGASVDTEVLEIQSRLLFPENTVAFHLAVSGRHVIYSGEILLCQNDNVWQKVWMVLFSDLILLCQVEPNKYLTVVHPPMSLQNLQNCNFTGNIENEFVLNTVLPSSSDANNSSVRLRAPTAEHKFTWKNIIEQRVSVLTSQHDLMIGRVSEICS